MRHAVVAGVEPQPLRKGWLGSSTWALSMKLDGAVPLPVPAWAVWSRVD